ncbi:isochorismatase family cysteine hydrolase [Flavobacterium sp. Root186]|uniref:isochorismatase family cysteine hydrolase n=1 Tax=Flavobacterium sp. Root186 TaxID=1736485 RepID=UPI0006FC0DFE|nr:isochorismatase family cysteine hydrolase [Flavobacterium sp. Root186]KRB55505.1 hypothetical protein ASD98_12570 [Flavobacterium sp. Root186]
MSNELLILIDPQNDFTNLDGFYAQQHQTSQITNTKQKINELLSLWNKNEIVVIYSNYQFEQFQKNLGIGIPDTFGHKLDNDFSFENDFTYISKNQHSAFTSKDFNDFLDNTNPSKLFLCGYLAEYCVEQTAIDALKNNYKVCLIEDCIGTGDDVQYRKDEMILKLGQDGAEMTNSNELIQQKNDRQNSQ